MGARGSPSSHPWDLLRLRRAVTFLVGFDRSRGHDDSPDEPTDQPQNYKKHRDDNGNYVARNAHVGGYGRCI